jgi:predicted ATPase
MKHNKLNQLSISGYKTFKQLHNFELRPLNILIGPNGAGKSNFIDFLIFLKEIIFQRMQLYVNKKGGADAHLYLGPKETRHITGSFITNNYEYKFSLEPTVDNRLIFFNESIVENRNQLIIDKGHNESKLKECSNRLANIVYDVISQFTAYHFHDTCETAYIRRQHTIRDNEKLRSDGQNLAAFLFHLKNNYQDHYHLIVDTIQIVAPFFNDFMLRPKLQTNGDQLIELEWSQKNTDYPFHPSQLSDGTLRFIALLTALLQPEPSPVMLFDEPELGLHPDALNVLAGVFKQASLNTQIIVATQSDILLNSFDAEDVIIVDRVNGASTLRRLNTKDLEEWLTNYTMGELWQKNMLEGGQFCD